MTYATNRGLVWVLDNVKKRGSGGGNNNVNSATGLASGPSSLQLPLGPPMSLTPQGLNALSLLNLSFNLNRHVVKNGVYSF